MAAVLGQGALCGSPATPSHVSLPRWSPEVGGRRYEAGRPRLYKWE